MFFRKSRILHPQRYAGIPRKEVCMLQKVYICGVDTAGLPKLSHKENEELMRRL